MLLLTLNVSSDWLNKFILPSSMVSSLVVFYVNVSISVYNLLSSSLRFVISVSIVSSLLSCSVFFVWHSSICVSCSVFFNFIASSYSSCVVFFVVSSFNYSSCILFVCVLVIIWSINSWMMYVCLKFSGPICNCV